MSVQKKKRYRTRAERVLGVMFEMGGREFCIEDVKLFIGAPNGGGGLQSPLQIEILKTHFVDTMMSKVVLDLIFSLNQPLKSADN